MKIVHEVLKQKDGNVWSIAPNDSVYNAIAKMADHSVGALLVVDNDLARVGPPRYERHLVGIISERDIVRGLPEHGAHLLSMKASELMTSSVKTCTPDDKVEDIMSEMTIHRFRHVPVVSDGKLCGIISIGDVVKNRLEELETETHVLRDFIVGRS